MPAIKISIPHKLGTEEAQQRIAGLVTETKEQFGHTVSDAKESWADNRGTFSFRAMGFSIAGNVLVEPSAVHVEINLPFAALLFKSRVEEEISTRAKELLA